MHRRGNPIEEDDKFRGSLWIEQEIAIASFMVQTFGVSLPTREYVQTGIQGEGVRGYIILNPIEFETTEDVLDDLDTWLPSLLTSIED